MDSLAPNPPPTHTPNPNTHQVTSSVDSAHASSSSINNAAAGVSSFGKSPKPCLVKLTNPIYLHKPVMVLWFEPQTITACITKLVALTNNSKHVLARTGSGNS